MNKRVVILILILSILFLTVGAAISATGPENRVAAPADGAGPRWFYEEIDVPGFYFGMGDRSLRVSDGSVPHLVYGASHLYLARYQNGAWTNEIVDGGVSVGEGASLALDANDRPHIAYKDTLKGKLRYAHWTGDRWQIQTLANVYPWNLQGTAIELDPAGRPHILYGGDVGNGGLYHAFWDGGGWQFESLFTGAFLGPSIAIDKSGHLHISFIDLYDAAMYGFDDGDGWQFEQVGSADFDVGTSVTLDSSGEPHIAYVSSAGGDGTSVMYAVRPAGVWTTTAVMNNTENVGVSLVLDDSDNPHIANGKAYLSFDGSAWHEEPIPGLSGNYFESIALDQASRPIISALRYGGPVECARHDGQQWIVDELARGSTTGSGNALAMGNDGLLQATYYDDPTDQLIHAVRQPGGWVTSVITTAVAEYPRQVSSLAVDGNNRPHVAYGRYNALNYAYWDGTDWLIEQIDDDLDGSLTIVVDGQSRPHAAYIGHNRVRYAVRTESGWQTEDVDHTDSTVSLALDSSDRPHLVFFEGSCNLECAYNLQHAVLTDSGWISDTVDGGAVGSAAAIAVDENDDLHVAYTYKPDPCELRYARWSGGEWHIETATSTNCQGEAVDIGLDGQGRPVITLYDAYANLRYAVRTDQGWQVALVAPGWVYDNHMIVDGNVIYVSFVYDSNRGLTLATSLPLDLDESAYLPLVVRS